MTVDVRVDDVVRLRKPHPCGASDWVVVRVGADIGLRCLGCGRRILLPRHEFRRRLRTIVRRSERPTPQFPPRPSDE
ncbi:MAG: DUF951 domain-containing protein [Thermomicrobium sp.]|nr:DUF951 domain-containing protein [Thermomicrobium sp.]